MGNLKFKISAGFWLFIVVAAVFRQGYLAAMYTVAVVLHETAHYIVAKNFSTVATKYVSVFSEPCCTESFRTCVVPIA